MRFFFVLGLGRSGTNFLASLLARDTRGVVHHEPYPYDQKLIWLRHAGSFDTVVDQMLEKRFETLLAAAGQPAFYGEVNSYLRYEPDWLRRRFDPMLLHVVRDGRDFVRSAWIRPVYTPFEPDGPILPRDDDRWAASWSAMSRFEQLCWYWLHTNEFLAARVERLVRFESVLADYDYFASRVLQPLGLEVARDVWRDEIGKPKNTSSSFRLRAAARRWLRGRRGPQKVDPLPHWSAWDDRSTKQFWSICGPAMERFGYTEGSRAREVPCVEG